MPLFLSELPGAANGNILPSRFVKPDPSLFCGYLQASTNDKIIGISQEGTRDAPNFVASLTGNATTDYAAVQGDEFQIFFAGDICMLTAGTGGWTNGDWLSSDVNGAGVTQAGSSFIGAIALSTVTAGELGQVLINICKS